MPLVNAEYLHQRLPHSELHVIDSGHFIWEDAADEYAALVNAWWADGFKRPHEDINRGGCQFLSNSVQRIITNDVTTPHV